MLTIGQFQSILTNYNITNDYDEDTCTDYIYGYHEMYNAIKEETERAPSQLFLKRLLSNKINLLEETIRTSPDNLIYQGKLDSVKHFWNIYMEVVSVTETQPENAEANEETRANDLANELSNAIDNLTSYTYTTPATWTWRTAYDTYASVAPLNTSYTYTTPATWTWRTAYDTYASVAPLNTSYTREEVDNLLNDLRNQLTNEIRNEIGYQVYAGENDARIRALEDRTGECFN